ncbi:MAG: 30S ribosome-binding factor RbfA [Deltaproteobacteria bacterium]|nr:30S ribosome-binding factor RbfA [Deltaproteobacteria bacterium]
MLAGKRTDRVGDQILKEIAILLLEKVMDPRVEKVTVTGIRISKDLKSAKVYYSVIGAGDDAARAQGGLDSAKGFIKKQLGLRMSLRYVPELRFIYDPTLAGGAHMDKLLEGLHVDEESDSGK